MAIKKKAVKKPIKKAVKKKAKKGAGGQPTRYKSEYGRIAKKACQLGATMDDLAELFGVTTQTIYNWRKRHPKEFFDAIKDGAEAANSDVERSLFKRAVGGHKITEKRVTVNADGSKTQMITEKEVAPDTVAQIFWLTNRDHGKWKRNPATQNDGDGDIFTQFANAVRDSLDD